jgi:hypothetical protein
VIIFILKTSILLRLEKARWRLEKQVSDNTEVLQVLDLTVYGVWWEMADSVSKSELEKFETFIGIYTTPNTQWFTGEMCFRVVHVVQFRPCFGVVHVVQFRPKLWYSAPVILILHCELHLGRVAVRGRPDVSHTDPFLGNTGGHR